MLKPVKKAGMKSYENMETDVYFIPSNAPKENNDSSIKFIKYMTSQEGQQIVADTRTVPATTLNLNISEGLKELVGYSATGNIIAGLNPCRMGSKMQSFIKSEVFSGPCSNTRSIDDTLKEMENLRLVIKSQTK
jgi:ABC-type glycerol-3-phosphate transport system substrate-binding protein